MYGTLRRSRMELGISSANHESSKLSGGDDGQEIWTATDQSMAMKKTVRYRECLKNHAVGIGGHAVDGCGEFMPSGIEGTLDALKCAACNCHRNFHRREVDGDQPPCHFCNDPIKDIGRKIPLNLPRGLPSSPARVNMARQHGQMIMALSNNNNNNHGHMQTEDHAHMGSFGHPRMLATVSMKRQKRFRTKFTQEQKDKMFDFAEKLGWRIQKPDDAAAQQFCMDLGVKRHVLKVWMHNNKHPNLGRKL